jgi:hypothetical protein
MNANGKVIQVQDVDGDELVEIATSDLSQRVYFIRVITGYTVTTNRIVGNTLEDSALNNIIAVSYCNSVNQI